MEYAWNDIKITSTAKASGIGGELMGLIVNELEEITAERAQIYVKHSKKIHSQYLLGMPFRGKPLEPIAETVKLSIADI